MANKVLIIEDDAALRASVVQTIELADLDPIPTNGFTQARRMIRSNFAGVILSDIRMPEHNGFDVLNFSRSKDPDLPVVLLTGHSDVPTAMRAMKEGAYDYLEKPCDPNRLTDVLRRALDHRQLVMENRAMRSGLDDARHDGTKGTLAERLGQHERRIIEEALSAENGRVADAAERLGVARNTLYDRIGKLQIIVASFKD